MSLKNKNVGLTQRVKINLFVKQNLFYFAQSND